MRIAVTGCEVVLASWELKSSPVLEFCGQAGEKYHKVSKKPWAFIACSSSQKPTVALARASSHPALESLPAHAAFVDPSPQDRRLVRFLALPTPRKRQAATPRCTVHGELLWLPSSCQLPSPLAETTAFRDGSFSSWHALTSPSGILYSNKLQGGRKV